MADAPSRWRGLGTAPTEDLGTDRRTKPPGETSQDRTEQEPPEDTTRPWTQFDDKPSSTRDLKPPRACAFIARGRGEYANMRIKMPSEAGPRHPLGQPLVGQKGGVSFF